MGFFMEPSRRFLGVEEEFCKKIFEEQVGVRMSDIEWGYYF